MITVYYVLAGLIAAASIIFGIGVMISSLDADDKEGIRGGALVVTLGILVAVLWPLVLAAIVPGIMVYGIVVGVKGIKNKTLDY